MRVDFLKSASSKSIQAFRSVGDYGHRADVGMVAGGGRGAVFRHFGLFERDRPLKFNNAGFFSISLELSKFLLAYKERKTSQYKYFLLVTFAKRQCIKEMSGSFLFQRPRQQPELPSHLITAPPPPRPEVAALSLLIRRMEKRSIFPLRQPVQRGYFIVLR